MGRSGARKSLKEKSRNLADAARTPNTGSKSQANEFPARRPTATTGLVFAKAIVTVVRHRFGQTQERLPTSKQMAEALNDAFSEAALRLSGLSAGAIDLKVMKKWGSQLMLLDESRYVPEFDGQNTIWLAASVSEKRRRPHTAQDTIELRAISGRSGCLGVRGPRRGQQRPASERLIFRSTAYAHRPAFDCQVTRALVNLVIERLAAGSIPDNRGQVLLHLGTTRQPKSEPIYRRGGNRRYEITIQPQTPEGVPSWQLTHSTTWRKRGV